ncbi:MAG: hypothetical protein ACTSYF_16825, partial [Promethearchaeota archaeon]
FILYLYTKQLYSVESFEFIIIRMISIIIINICFIFIMLIIDIEFSIKITIYIIIIGISFYIYYILKGFLDWLPYWWDFWDLIVFLVYAIIPLGMILFTIYYIRKDSSKYIGKIFEGKYHIHESFLGAVLMMVAFILMILLFVLSQFEVFLKEFYFILEIISLFLFYFLFFGGFLLFRDWNDFLQGKFIEKHTENEEDYSIKYKSAIFNELGGEDLHFFVFPKHKMFPFAIALTSIALSTVVYRLKLFPYEIFYLTPDFLLIVGFLCGFISGGMLGKDWFRLFKKFYPELYQEIEDILNKLE